MVAVLDEAVVGQGPTPSAEVTETIVRGIARTGVRASRGGSAVSRTVADHLVHHATELRAESQRWSPTHQLHPIERFGRRNGVGLGIAVRVGGNVVAVLPDVDLDRLGGVEPPKSDSVGREAGPLCLRD